MDERRDSSHPRTKRDAPAPETPRDELTADEIDGLAELHSEEIARAERAPRNDPRPSKRQRRTEKTLDSVLERLRHLDEEVRELRETAQEPRTTDDPAEGMRVEAVILPPEPPVSAEERPRRETDPRPALDEPHSVQETTRPGEAHGAEPRPASPFVEEHVASYDDEPARSATGTLLVIAAIVILGAVTGLLILGS